MAGYAYGLDEGGAIPDDQDNSGALPVVGSGENGQTQDNSGALPVVGGAGDQQQAAPAEAGPRSGIDFNAGNVPGNAKRIIQYLLGAGAAHPEVADKFATAVKMEHPGTSDDDANLISILKAKQQGGDAAASALLQSHMQQYNAKNAIAYAAMTGTQGKPADPNAAAKAATQASQHMLDGSTTSFAVDQSGGGFTATVTTPDGKHQNFSLTPQQFAAWVKPGGEGQWDKVLTGHGNIANALSQVTQSQDSGQGSGQTSTNADTSEEGGGWQGDVQRYQRGEFDDALKAAGQKPFKKSADDQEEANENAKLDAQSRKIFPWASQEHQRQLWIAQQQSEQANRQNKIDVEKEKGTYRVQTQESKNTGLNKAAETKANASRDVAKTRADASIQAAKERAVAEAAKQAAVSGREDDRRRAKIFATLVNSSNITSQADIDKAAKAAGITLNQPATSAPAQAQPIRQEQPVPQAQNPNQALRQQAERPAGVPAGAKLYQGKWYTRGPNGEAVPVQ